MLTHVRKRDVLLVRLEGEMDQCSTSGIRRDIDALLRGIERTRRIFARG